MSRRPAPVSTTDLLNWALLTLRRDWRQYEGASRPLTWRRIEKSLSPTVRRPVFVIGAPRSGTSFLGRCIGRLPEVSYHFEPAATQRAAQHVYFDRWSFERAARVYRTVYRWLLRIHLDGDLRYADKSPRNCFLVSFLHRVFPGAQFVHIIRDGRDAALSHSKKPWLQAAAAASGEQGVGGHQFGPYARFWVEEDRVETFETTTDYHRCIWAWRRHVERALRASKELSPDQYHEVRYERLARAPTNTGMRLLDALGIHHEASRARLLDQVRTAHDESVGAWRRELSTEQWQTAREEAGAVLDRLGYIDGAEAEDKRVSGASERPSE
ncbi:MAG: sulfotransferase [Salinibacter sp.]